jgi:hypothetical protein
VSVGSNVAAFINSHGFRMKVERKATTQPPFVQTPRLASHIDVLDHVLDKGIVIDAHMRIAVGGLHLFTVDARMVVASFDTYLEHCEGVRGAPPLFDGHELKYVAGLHETIGSNQPPAKESRRKPGAKRPHNGKTAS